MATKLPAPDRSAPPDVVSRIVRKNLPALIASCRREILARPRLRQMVQQFRIDDSDDWLRQAVALFQMCMKSCGPAVEWHDEMGELSVDVGLTIEDAGDCLCIIRDEILRLVWDAARRRLVAAREVPALVGAVLRGFDCGMAAQASAYVRESRRRLGEVNKQLEIRQAEFGRDLGLAQLVQRHFIPEGFESKNFRAEVRYISTVGIGGDHAGIFPVGDDRLYVTISDVTGHGIASALVAEVVNSRLQPLFHSHTDTLFQYAVEPVDIVRELNTLFFQEFQDLGMLLTFFVALFDSTESTITYSGAGHPPPLLQRRGDAVLKELRSQNIILGAEEDCVLDEGQSSLPFQLGDRVIFYTDGIIEASHDENILDLSGLRLIVENNTKKPSPALADEIINTARRMAGPDSADDMSVIVLDILTGPQPA